MLYQFLLSLDGFHFSTDVLFEGFLEHILIGFRFVIDLSSFERNLADLRSACCLKKSYSLRKFYSRWMLLPRRWEPVAISSSNFHFFSITTFSSSSSFRISDRWTLSAFLACSRDLGHHPASFWCERLFPRTWWIVGAFYSCQYRLLGCPWRFSIIWSDLFDGTQFPLLSGCFNDFLEILVQLILGQPQLRHVFFIPSLSLTGVIVRSTRNYPRFLIESSIANQRSVCGE